MKRNKKHENRVKKLIVACGLCAIILTVSTYAWFIGMKTVNVSAFDVKIAAIDGLDLSLTGGANDDWGPEVTINETNYNNLDGYTTGNTNSWGGTGLIPMSSVGVINATSSRLTMFEKGSFTATPGGYRIMASEVLNTDPSEPEANGYVAFDLFIRNKSGNKYYPTVNKDNEEAIYLTPESTVKVAASGNNEQNSGIENSVRVAFAQIGRVEISDDTSLETIQGIDCGATKEGVLGICADRVAQIWEPNDTKHVKNAINWYDTSCKKRTGDGLDAYSGDCGTVVDGTAVPTYAVSGEILDTHKVDAYDGAEFNGYAGTTIVLSENEDTKNIMTKAAAGKLLKYPYFTDTMKHLEGTARPTFMTLAPKSITKVRVYVYLEGQDIDNYDFASLGKKISVAFGFTKERFYGEDIDYNTEAPYGPDLNVDYPGLQNRPATQTVTP